MWYAILGVAGIAVGILLRDRFVKVPCLKPWELKAISELGYQGINAYRRDDVPVQVDVRDLTKRDLGKTGYDRKWIATTRGCPGGGSCYYDGYGFRYTLVFMDGSLQFVPYDEETPKSRAEAQKLGDAISRLSEFKRNSIWFVLEEWWTESEDERTYSQKVTVLRLPASVMMTIPRLEAA